MVNLRFYEVVFASGKRVPVQRFAYQDGCWDLAMLQVSTSGLRKGVDYVLIPYRETLCCSEGDAVVAVGSPLGLEGTQTYGHISAIRRIRHGEQSLRIIQTDAAVNPGNSRSGTYG